LVDPDVSRLINRLGLILLGAGIVVFSLSAYVSSLGAFLNLWLLTQAGFWAFLIFFLGGAAIAQSTKDGEGSQRIFLWWGILSGISLVFFLVSFFGGVMGGFWAWDVQKRRIEIEYERAHPTPKPIPAADRDVAKRIALHNDAFAINTRSGTNVAQGIEIERDPQFEDEPPPATVIVSSCKALYAIYPSYYPGESPFDRAQTRLNAFWRTQSGSHDNFSADARFAEPGSDGTEGRC
jgi:hypothetical protein